MWKKSLRSLVILTTSFFISAFFYTMLEAKQTDHFRAVGCTEVGSSLAVRFRSESGMSRVVTFIGQTESVLVESLAESSIVRWRDLHVVYVPGPDMILNTSVMTLRYRRDGVVRVFEGGVMDDACQELLAHKFKGELRFERA